MSDPVEITQQATQAQQAGGVVAGLGALGIAATAFAKLWSTIFGSRKERQDANERAAELALRAAEHADERAERADESHRMALGTCEEQLRTMRAENKARDEAHAEAFRLVREELDSLRAENKALREQTAWQQRAINRLLAGSTPPEGIHPDEVRAGVAALEDIQ